MRLKNKIISIALCVLIAGFGIFNSASNTVNAQIGVMSSGQLVSSFSIYQLEQIIANLQQQILNMAQLIAQRNQPTITDGGCAYQTLAGKCTTDSGSKCYGEGQGLAGYTTSDAASLSCCAGLTASPRTSCSGNVCSGEEGFICLKTAANKNDAKFSSESAPAIMTAKKDYYVSVTMLNNGTQTWTAAGGYRLGSQNPQDNSTWGTGRVYLDATDSIAPGQSKTFKFNITAPEKIGTYPFQWQMLKENVEWFGQKTGLETILVTDKKTDSELKANTQACVSNSECASGICNNTVCCNAGQCGWGAENGLSPMCINSGSVKSNQWLLGICRNGAWKTAAGGWGCGNADWACDSGTCSNNICMANIVKNPIGTNCTSNSDCASGVCNNTYCVPNATYCGGVKSPMYFANGEYASNPWFDGYCRNGNWKTKLGGNCSVWPCEQGTCVNNVCTTPKKANGEACTSASDCESGICKGSDGFWQGTAANRPYYCSAN